jgi:hypothetical protein
MLPPNEIASRSISFLATHRRLPGPPIEEGTWIHAIADGNATHKPPIPSSNDCRTNDVMTTKQPEANTTPYRTAAQVGLQQTHRRVAKTKTHNRHVDLSAQEKKKRGPSADACEETLRSDRWEQQSIKREPQTQPQMSSTGDVHHLLPSFLCLPFAPIGLLSSLNSSCCPNVLGYPSCHK